MSPLPDLPDERVAGESARAWAQADPQLANLLSSGLPMPRALLRWGTDLLRTGRAGDAVTVLRAAVALIPGEASAWTGLGVALDRAGDSALALGAFERSVALSHAQPDVWLLLGMARERQGDLRGAESDYRIAVDLSPTSAPAWKCLGTICDRLHDPIGASRAFGACLKLGPPDAAVAALLGKALYEDGKLSEAHDAYANAQCLAPDNPHFARMARRTRFLRDIIHGATVDAALVTFRAAGDPPSSEADIDTLLDGATGELAGFGHHVGALAVATRRVALYPDSPSAAYLLTSLQGAAPPARSPDAYLVENFDAFADRFDAQLVGVLGYDVPQKLCAMLTRGLPPGSLYDVLDGGCGTGLCAPLLRPVARHLTGVDLSPKMLERAEERTLYDALVCEELTSFLARSPGAFDLMTFADVLIYFGDLRPLFDAAARALRQGGLLAVSFESGYADAGTGAGGWQLLTSGRYAQTPSYVRAALGSSFDVVAEELSTLRREGRDRVPGQLWVLQRRA